jgi:hypothetical protein
MSSRYSDVSYNGKKIESVTSDFHYIFAAVIYAVTFTITKQLFDQLRVRCIKMIQMNKITFIKNNNQITMKRNAYFAVIVPLWFGPGVVGVA